MLSQLSLVIAKTCAEIFFPQRVLAFTSTSNVYAADTAHRLPSCFCIKDQEFKCIEIIISIIHNVFSSNKVSCFNPHLFAFSFLKNIYTAVADFLLTREGRCYRPTQFKLLNNIIQVCW